MAGITTAGSVSNTTAGNKTVTFTPAVGDLIVVIAVSTGLASGTTAVTDDQGGTYTQVDVDRTGFSTTGGLTAWIRNGLISNAVQHIVTAAQAGSTGGGLCVLQVSGMSYYGAAALRSSGGQSTGTAGTTPAPVLSNTPLTTNPIILSVANGTNSTTTVTQRTSFTEACDLGYNTPATGFEVCWRASGETTATQTLGSTTASAFASIALELDASTPPSGPVHTSTRRRSADRFLVRR